MKRLDGHGGGAAYYESLISRADMLMSPCRLCERKCGAKRAEGEFGFCGLNDKAYVFKDFIHFGEEAELIPSHTVYLSACNLRCSFCSNRRHVVNPSLGNPLDCKALAKRIEGSFAAGAGNVNFLGGEPTVSLPSVLRILRELDPAIPVVWNSNMLMSEEAMEIVASFADFHLADFKFGDDSCAESVAGVQGYVRTVSRNIIAAADSKAGVILRHLPLEGHLHCCSMPIMKWVAKNAPSAKVHVLETLIPNGNGEIRGAATEELKELDSLMNSLGLRRVPRTSMEERISALRALKGKLRTAHESDIFISPDGTVSIQDMDAGLADFAGGLCKCDSD